MDDSAGQIVIDLAKRFISEMRIVAPGFDRAFFRFSSTPAQYGANASYVDGDEVRLLDPFISQDLFDTMNDMGRSLFNVLNRSQGLFLLTINQRYDFNVEFEWSKLDRWSISKLDGASGIPAGIELPR